jgi:uncharacterized 2Fe-2S/4Fe-4S cluster protein (DUF4445 family)
VRVRISFLPKGKKIEVKQGTRLLEAAFAAGIPLDSLCGGKGKCGKCKIKIINFEKLPPLDQIEKERLSAEEIKNNYRLACRTRALSDLIVEVPSPTLSKQKILIEGKAEQIIPNPRVKKVFLEIGPPTLTNPLAYETQLRTALAKKGFEGLTFDLELLRELKSKLKAADYRVTAVLIGNKIVSIEPRDTTQKSYGVAFDLGTTTVVGYLIDLISGKQLGVASSLNPQIIYGEDVVSRINFAITDKEGLDRLYKLAIQVVNNLIADLVAKAGIKKENIYELNLVGNTCMHHLCLKLDPSSLAISPYVPLITHAVDVPASQLGIRANKQTNVHLLPTVAGFVGADLRFS